MKKLTTLILAAFVCTSVALAQDSTATDNKMQHDTTMKMTKDGVSMEDGKLLVTKDGKTAPLDQEVTLSNGATVATDGTIKMKDGTTRQLKNGECVLMDGSVINKKDKKTKPEGQ